MSDKIIRHSYVPSEKSHNQIGLGGGTCSTITWEGLKPYLETVMRLRDNEYILGFEVDAHGIKVYFGQVKNEG